MHPVPIFDLSLQHVHMLFAKAPGWNRGRRQLFLSSISIKDKRIKNNLRCLQNIR